MNSGASFSPTSLVVAAVVFVWLLCWQAVAAAAQVSGVAGAGNLDANLPQPIGSPTATASGTPPGRGEVFDREALEHAKTFCVDLSHMESSQAGVVKQFLAKESQPKKLLSRVPWQLVGDCTKADAVARIYFAQVDVRQQVTCVNLASRSARSRQGSQPVILLYDKASIRLFYRAEGDVSHKNAVDMLGSPFAMLVKDLKKINRNVVKGS